MPLSPATIKKAHLDFIQREKTQLNHFPIDQLIQTRTNWLDTQLSQLWQYYLADQPFALYAVGGYGRKEMFPQSDLDLFILYSSPLNIQQKQQIEAFIQHLWDSGFQLGISIRSLEECIEEGKKDITIATNLLERRFLCGEFFDEKTLEPLQNLWTKEAFFQAKVIEQKNRYARFHHTSYNLEPDIKYNPGGLRDLHFIYWLALRMNKGKNLEDLKQIVDGIRFVVPFLKIDIPVR